MYIPYKLLANHLFTNLAGQIIFIFHLMKNIFCLKLISHVSLKINYPIEDILSKNIYLNLKILLHNNLIYILCRLLTNYLFTNVAGETSFHFLSHGKSSLFKIYFTHVSLKKNTFLKILCEKIFY